MGHVVAQQRTVQPAWLVLAVQWIRTDRIAMEISYVVILRSFCRQKFSTALLALKMFVEDHLVHLCDFLLRAWNRKFGCNICHSVLGVSTEF